MPKLEPRILWKISPKPSLHLNLTCSRKEPEDRPFRPGLRASLRGHSNLLRPHLLGRPQQPQADAEAQDRQQRHQAQRNARHEDGLPHLPLLPGVLPADHARENIRHGRQIPRGARDRLHPHLSLVLSESRHLRDDEQAVSARVSEHAAVQFQPQFGFDAESDAACQQVASQSVGDVLQECCERDSEGVGLRWLTRCHSVALFKTGSYGEIAR